MVIPGCRLGAYMCDVLSGTAWQIHSVVDAALHLVELDEACWSLGPHDGTRSTYVGALNLEDMQAIGWAANQAVRACESTETCVAQKAFARPVGAE